MHVIATAGHVDHGKSTLVRALTGQDPDRLKEEHRRGLSIELGYCWTSLDGAGDVAFVDVPGHERFVSTMLAGVGPVPAVLFVVAADDPWMPQAAEHLAALHAFGVRRGVVAVTRSDLADPRPSIAQARQHLDATTLRDAPIVAVSAQSGLGLDELRQALVTMVAALPVPASDDAVRLWVDRCFSVTGAGTVVTGTLPSGTVTVGDDLSAGGAAVRVRGIETLGRPCQSARGVARVALRLGSGAPADVRRGVALFARDAWQVTDSIDVRVDLDGAGIGAAEPKEPGGLGESAEFWGLPEAPLLHVGSASMRVRARPLGHDLCRLRLERPLPLHVGDRVVLRDPGSRTLWGAVVLDPAPPLLRRRGAARRRAAELASSTGGPDLADELRRRIVVGTSTLRRLGVVADDARIHTLAIRAGDWLLERTAAEARRLRLAELVDERRLSHPLETGLPLVAAARALSLPTPELVAALVREPLTVVEGRVVGRSTTLPDAVLSAVATLERELAARPFAAPAAGRLVELGLDAKTLAAAARAGLVLRLDEAVVLMPGADLAAVDALRDLPQPFTTSQARARLDTSRRVVLPLLALLDSRRLTRRLPDDRREVVAPPPADPT